MIPDGAKTAEAFAVDGPLQQASYSLDREGPVNPVDIAVTIDAGAPLAAVRSSYHDTMIEKSGGNKIAVSLVKEQENADRDFELVWSVTAGAAPQAALFTHPIAANDSPLLISLPPHPHP